MTNLLELINKLIKIINNQITIFANGLFESTQNEQQHVVTHHTTLF